MAEIITSGILAAERTELFKASQGETLTLKLTNNEFCRTKIEYGEVVDEVQLAEDAVNNERVLTISLSAGDSIYGTAEMANKVNYQLMRG